MKLLIALACLAVSNGQFMNNWAGNGYNAWNPYNMGMATTYAANAPMMNMQPAWNTMAGMPAGHGFSYSDGWSTRTEKSMMGATSGSYSYIDGAGQLQTVNYKADAGGFRVAGTNLPVMKMAAPMPVDDTPEVKAAKAKFMAKFRMAEMGEAAPMMKMASPMMKMAAPMPVQDTPEVAAAKAEFMAKFMEAEAMSARKKRSLVVGLGQTPASTAPLYRAPLIAPPLRSAYWSGLY